MSTTSQVKRDFLKEPLGTESVTIVPGIGEVLGDKLIKKKGISTAKQLFGHYLIAPDDFKDLIMSVGGNSKHQKDAYEAMKEYDEQHLD